MALFSFERVIKNGRPIYADQAPVQKGLEDPCDHSAKQAVGQGGADHYGVDAILKGLCGSVLDHGADCFEDVHFRFPFCIRVRFRFLTLSS